MMIDSPLVGSVHRGREGGRLRQKAVPGRGVGWLHVRRVRRRSSGGCERHPGASSPDGGDGRHVDLRHAGGLQIVTFPFSWKFASISPFPCFHFSVVVSAVHFEPSPTLPCSCLISSSPFEGGKSCLSQEPDHEPDKSHRVLAV